jgi:hypothetical protein
MSDCRRKGSKESTSYEDGVVGGAAVEPALLGRVP